MRLETYLKRQGEAKAAFAVRSGVPRSTVQDVCRGCGCSVDTALLIIKATDNEVRLVDLKRREEG